MLKVPVHDHKGKIISEVELKPEIFESKIVESLVHQMVKLHLAEKRSGNASTKTRKDVSGGGIKPWKQKGTGRARAGSIRSPLWKGGGTVFGPTPRDYSFKVSKKAKRLALRSALSAKAKDFQILVLKNFNLKKPKTKDVVEVLKNVSVGKKTTMVLTSKDEIAKKSIKNIQKVKAIDVEQINVYDVLDNEILIFTQDALNALSEVLK
ncbi:50S ribosomal protein L4 [Candidatus Oleimmundimicrobium sp.]|uniref:50S ribosomal protein L4 n=1 Tax=Candidatus Oleimmundimicrobium sp. TaxID=3060597 RepID=UPI0027261174|nr:50S ribosomal protein L4 [Candidatus Oleimmundimicrobium sp.]MDO8886061.1 50S ribosomal protein L4 [Candidatus Oleimmundimicrobium sp.]